MKLIFVGGCHGVGKSTLCATAAQRLGIVHRSASALIREMDATAISLQSKDIADLDSNQKLLIARVRQLEEELATLLLDGHYAISVIDRGVQAIPVAVFSALRPAALVHVAGPAESVHRQLVQRDGSSAWDEEQVAHFQRADLDQARIVAGELNLTLYETSPDAVDAFVAWVSTTSQ